MNSLSLLRQKPTIHEMYIDNAACQSSPDINSTYKINQLLFFPSKLFLVMLFTEVALVEIMNI